MLGEITHDDATYAGEDGESIFSIQYYRNKVTEFQAVAQGLDTAAWSLTVTADLIVDDPEQAGTYAAISALLDEYDSRRQQMAVAVEAINAASAAANSVGVRFPVLSQPLGAVPLVVMGAIAAAVAGIAALIVWGREWIARSYDAQQTAAAIAAASTITDPAVRNATIASITTQVAATQAALAKAENPLSSIANVAKWAGIAGLAFIGWMMFDRMTKRGA